ncbi:MAG: 50S ribosomal protein L10 [Desulfosudaceae bacterium]
MLNLEAKKVLVEDLHARFEKAAIVILTDYKGLSVDQINDLRRQLTEAGVEFKVVRNTLIRRASADTDAALADDFFVGPTAVALGYDDPVAPAKILSDFAKKNNKLEIKAGTMNGSLLNVKQISSLAQLPSRDELLSQFLSVLNGVPTAFVRVLNAVPAQLVNVLSAIKDQKEAA